MHVEPHQTADELAELIRAEPRARVARRLSVIRLCALRGEDALLIWDGAGYHLAKALRIPGNLTAVTLPPYSPELNPVERLWLYLRQDHWSNRVYADIDALEEAAVAGWRAVCLHPEKVKTICRCEYLPPGS